MSEPRNQKAICPLCGIDVIIGEDTEETACPNCTYQFRTNWGRIKDALKVIKLTQQRDALLAACETLVKATFQEDITKATRQAKAAIAAANKE